MKNKLSDLNNHLFAQLERLGEEGLTSEQIADEVKRSEAITDVADQIIRDAERDYHARFAAHRLRGEWFAPHPDILAEIEHLNGGSHA